MAVPRRRGRDRRPRDHPLEAPDRHPAGRLRALRRGRALPARSRSCAASASRPESRRRSSSSRRSRCSPGSRPSSPRASGTRSATSATTVEEGTAKVTNWLLTGPLDLTREELDDYREQGLDELRERQGDIAGGIAGGAYIAVEVVAGLLLTLVLAFFFLKDGEKIWPWLVGLFPPRARGRADDVGRIAWATLGGYLRGVVLIAFVDAVFIGLALWLIGVPLVLPLTLLTFIGGFFPIVGAFSAGAAATLVALVTGGVTDALLVLAATIGVQQLESHLLQPVVMSRAVKMHPIGVLLAVATGAVVWGIVGAALAVPLAAVIARSASHLRSGPDEALVAPDPAPPPGTDPDDD